MTMLGVGLVAWGFVFYWMIRREIHASRSALLEQLTHLTARVAQLEEGLHNARR